MANKSKSKEPAPNITKDPQFELNVDTRLYRRQDGDIVRLPGGATDVQRYIDRGFTVLDEDGNDLELGPDDKKNEIQRVIGSGFETNLLAVQQKAMLDNPLRDRRMPVGPVGTITDETSTGFPSGKDVGDPQAPGPVMEPRDEPITITPESTGTNGQFRTEDGRLVNNAGAPEAEGPGSEDVTRPASESTNAAGPVEGEGGDEGDGSGDGGGKSGGSTKKAAAKK